MKYNEQQLEFLELLFFTNGEAKCPNYYTQSEYSCLVTPNDCPINKYKGKNKMLCTYDRAYRIAKTILEKNYPIKYLELCLKKDIK
jgi:hypothetical protein